MTSAINKSAVNVTHHQMKMTRNTMYFVTAIYKTAATASHHQMKATRNTMYFVTAIYKTAATASHHHHQMRKTRTSVSAAASRVVTVFPPQTRIMKTVI